MASDGFKSAHCLALEQRLRNPKKPRKRPKTPIFLAGADISVVHHSGVSAASGVLGRRLTDSIRHVKRTKTDDGN
jgi:hypothetical protein